MKWGYKLADGKLIFNARSETVAQKTMFADGMRQCRCLIPADSYYERQKTGDGKQKYEIAPSDADDSIELPDGEYVDGSFDITVDDNELIRAAYNAGQEDDHE